MDPSSESEKYALILSSWLFKRSKSHSWQKKWCVLRRNQLSYYKDSKEYKASRVIPVEDILSFSEIPDGHKWHFIVVTSQRVFHMRAGDAETYGQWVRAMTKLLEDKEAGDGAVGVETGIKNEANGPEEDDEEEDEEEEEDDDDQEDSEQLSHLMPPPPMSESDQLHQDFQNLHFSGTDDNFTSGGVSESDTGRPSLSNNNSTVSLQHFKERELPTPIPEESEIDMTSEVVGQQEEQTQEQQQQQEVQQESPKRTVYFNSFSSTSPEHVIDTGYLYRLKKRYNQWKKYYITLTNHYLYFYKNSRDLQAKKEYKKIDLDEILDCVELDPLSRSRVFCMLIVTPKKRLRFCADSEEELTKWLVLLKTIVKTRKNERSV